MPAIAVTMKCPSFLFTELGKAKIQKFLNVTTKPSAPVGISMSKPLYDRKFYPCMQTGH
jgi:hypothetical protein